MKGARMANMRLIFDIQARIRMTVRAGEITSSAISLASDPDKAAREADVMHQLLERRRLHEITDWPSILVHGLGDRDGEAKEVGLWLNTVLGN